MVILYLLIIIMGVITFTLSFFAEATRWTFRLWVLIALIWVVTDLLRVI